MTDQDAQPATTNPGWFLLAGSGVALVRGTDPMDAAQALTTGLTRHAVPHVDRMLAVDLHRAVRSLEPHTDRAAERRAELYQAANPPGQPGRIPAAGWVLWPHGEPPEP